MVSSLYFFCFISFILSIYLRYLSLLLIWFLLVVCINTLLYCHFSSFSFFQLSLLWSVHSFILYYLYFLCFPVFVPTQEKLILFNALSRYSVIVWDRVPLFLNRYCRRCRLTHIDKPGFEGYVDGTSTLPLLSCAYCCNS